MSGKSVCAVILTFNEAANLARVLKRLEWSRKVIVLDSHSSDATEMIARSFANVEFHVRNFDSHAAQWNAALSLVPDDFQWVLALDADYVLSLELADELSSGRFGHADVYFAAVKYMIMGRALRCGIYPPVALLFRRGLAEYEQQGHTQRLMVRGLRAGRLRGVVFHDDRKPFRQWLFAQVRYALKEAELPDCHGALRKLLRKLPPLAGLAVFIYVYFLRRGFMDGREGLIYAAQRAVAETMIATSQVCRVLEDTVPRPDDAECGDAAGRRVREL